MNIQEKRLVNIQGLMKNDLSNINVNYIIDNVQYQVEFVFDEKVIDMDNFSSKIDKIVLSAGGNVIYTFYNCISIYCSEMKCKLDFGMSVEGEDFDSLDNLLCTGVKYKIDSYPITLTEEDFLPTDSVIERINCLIMCNKCDEAFVVSIKTTKEMKELSELETIFFDLLDITFLINGYYPYIIEQMLIINGKKIKINRKQQHIYGKGNSYSHWKKRIASCNKIELNDVYPKYLKIIQKNKLIIPVLRNALHDNQAYSDLILCNLLQCIEGYMKKFHVREKYAKTIVDNIKDEIEKNLLNYTLPEDAGVTIEEIVDSVRGIIGIINFPSFKECLDMAINMNENTKLIFKQEEENKVLDVFLMKSKNTRNQFSHMVPLNKTIQNGLELYKAINKYGLLLRIMILSDIEVGLYKGSVERYVRQIDFAR